VTYASFEINGMWHCVNCVKAARDPIVQKLELDMPTLAADQVLDRVLEM
jgi:hypothetical protein